MRGWIQGYNAQAACNDQHLIVAAEVMTASPDFGNLGPMLTAARRELANAGATKRPNVVVADAGYWHLEQMNQITGDGIPVLIPPDSSRRANKPKRPGWDGGAYDFMRSVLDMLAYERESDSTLVIGAGVPESWVLERPGVTVRRLSTHYGPLSFTMRNEGGNIRVSMQAGVRMPPGGIVVRSPFTRPPRDSRVNGVSTSPLPTGGVVVRAVPAEVVFRP